MRRLVPAVLVALVALVALAVLATPAAAESRSEQRELEALVAELESLIALLDGDAIRPPDITRLSDGLTMASFPLDSARPIRAERPGRRDARAAKNFQNLSAGHSKPQPKALDRLITTTLSNLNTRYHFWWCLVNFSNAKTANTIYKLKGPGNIFNDAVPIEYPASAITCLFLKAAEGVGESGVYTWQVKVAGGGLAKEKFFAQ